MIKKLLIILTPILLSSCVPITGLVSVEMGTWEVSTSVSLENTDGNDE